MSTQKGFTPILLILLLAAITIGGGFIYWNQTKSNTNTQTPQVITKSSPSPTLDETTNWKTYTSIEHGFSIKYPSEFEVNNPSFKTIEKDVTFTKVNINTNYFLVISISSLENSKNLSFQQLVDEISDASFSSEIYSNIKANQVKTKIDGFDAITQEVPAQYAGYKTYLLKKDKLYVFKLDTGNEKPMNEKRIYDQILSTFKFL